MEDLNSSSFGRGYSLHIHGTLANLHPTVEDPEDCGCDGAHGEPENILKLEKETETTLYYKYYKPVAIEEALEAIFLDHTVQDALHVLLLLPVVHHQLAAVPKGQAVCSVDETKHQTHGG